MWACLPDIEAVQRAPSGKGEGFRIGVIDAYLAVVIGGAVLAGFVQGLSGFAFSLAALSVWVWAVDPQTAAPMAVFGSLVGQAVACR